LAPVATVEAFFGGHDVEFPAQVSFLKFIGSVTDSKGIIETQSKSIMSKNVYSRLSFLKECD
jgi:hypothetical protein